MRWAGSPLDDNSLDVAVFSPSLMGSNWADYLKEAYREAILPPVHRRARRKVYGRVEELKDAVEGTGFCMLGDVEQRYDFVYVTALKG